MKDNIYVGITKKFADQIGIKKLYNIDIYSPTINMWHASLKYINRKKCIIFMNDLTRYSFFLYGIKKKDLEHLDNIFYDSLIDNLRFEEFTHEEIMALVDPPGDIELIKTNNRSVNGSITQFFKDLEYYFCANMNKYIEFEGQMNLRVLNKRLNDTPLCCSDKGFFPIERMKEELKKMVKDKE